MSTHEPFYQRHTTLTQALQNTQGDLPHSLAFVCRLFGYPQMSQLHPDVEALIDSRSDHTAYGGFPCLAALGYFLGAAETLSAELVQRFLNGMKRLQQRPHFDELVYDDVALLGIADGLSRISQKYSDTTEACHWLLQVISTPSSEQWSHRMRMLAGDLLDQRGRLRVHPDQFTEDVIALDSVLRAVWPQAFVTVSPIENDRQKQTFRSLLVLDIPQDIERIAIWLKCLDIWVNATVASLAHTSSDTVRLLERAQDILNWWVWRSESCYEQLPSIFIRKSEVRKQREQLPKLRGILSRHFNLEELRTICFDLNVDFDSLAGEEKVGKARELIAYLERQGGTPKLLDRVKELRPDVMAEAAIENQTISSISLLETSETRSHWLINDEYHVQSLLWTILYPIYGASLVDERVLPDWGFVQPCSYLGITTLNLIITIKVVCTLGDFSRIEEEIETDLAVFLEKSGVYNKMIVFIYVDFDQCVFGQCNSLKKVLKQQDHIEDIVFLYKPGMQPD
jgi:hypothetical protein